MNNVCAIDEARFKRAALDAVGPVRDESTRRSVRWTTKQVLFACLWSTLFGVACGYAWLFLQAD
jgi:hypothetical protein